MPDLSEVVNDPDRAEYFTVFRSVDGVWGPGGWSDSFDTLSYYGIVSIADPATVQSLPEGDRIEAAIVINCELPLYVTRIAGEDCETGNDATSDVVRWENANYRVY